MSVAIPQSHLYIFTEEQRNGNYYEEACCDNFLNFSEYMKTVFNKDFNCQLKKPGFWDVLKGSGLLMLALLIVILMACCLFIGFVIGLFILMCRAIVQFIGGLFKCFSLK